jgi:hypothetical protein
MGRPQRMAACPASFLTSRFGLVDIRELNLTGKWFCPSVATELGVFGKSIG